MKNPKPVNFSTSEEIRAAGWAAEARDADGHLMTTHAPFSSDTERYRYVSECAEEGWTLTIWPTR